MGNGSSICEKKTQTHSSNLLQVNKYEAVPLIYLLLIVTHHCYRCCCCCFSRRLRSKPHFSLFIARHICKKTPVFLPYDAVFSFFLIYCLPYILKVASYLYCCIADPGRDSLAESTCFSDEGLRLMDNTNSSAAKDDALESKVSLRRQHQQQRSKILRSGRCRICKWVKWGEVTSQSFQQKALMQSCASPPHECIHLYFGSTASPLAAIRTLMFLYFVFFGESRYVTHILGHDCCLGTFFKKINMGRGPSMPCVHNHVAGGGYLRIMLRLSGFLIHI